MISKAILAAFEEKVRRCWDTLYFAIDLHGTIIKKYTNNEIILYEYAEDALQLLSSTRGIVLILFTSTYSENLKEFYNWCSARSICFQYLNENPECKNNATGDFSKKFYYNVLVDDRAGFDPETDWKIIINTINKNI